MEDKDKAIAALHQKIEALLQQHQQFHREIEKLQNELFALQVNDLKQKAPETKYIDVTPQPLTGQPKPVSQPLPQQPQTQTKTQPPLPPFTLPKKPKTPIEEFIGTNLLNKIGIAVLVIGIGFGAKYSIDHAILSPMTRIILGHLAGIALIVLAIRLKKMHANFSAVLLSGGMAVLYFLTFAAYSFYGLIPQVMAFVLMVLYTAFTVFAAIQYNRQVIGIIGMVGAYAVPFLLSDGSGRVVILFSYVTIINTGILILAFKKEWKALYYLAFALTWIIFTSWFSFAFDPQKHFWISISFATIFFITFYATFLAYKLVRKEPLARWDIVVMLLNSFIYFTFGYASLDRMENGDQYLGLFTLFTACIHFAVSVILYKRQAQFRDVFYFAAGMVLVFLTLAVPVQLEGNWVTLVWAGEAALLFWIGRTKALPTYEKLSYPLIILALGSLIHDWESYRYYDYIDQYDPANHHRLFLNIQFLTTIAVAASLAFITWLGSKTDYAPAFVKGSLPDRAFVLVTPILLGLILYFGIFKEIEMYWQQRYVASAVVVPEEGGSSFRELDKDLLRFQSVWLVMYSALFAMALAALYTRLKKQLLFFVVLALNVMVLVAFVTSGLFELSNLRESYISQDLSNYYERGIGHILIRYAALALMIPLLVIQIVMIKRSGLMEIIKHTNDVFVHTIIITILSSELVHWLDLGGVQNTFKLALSILWGAYALFLIVVGLRKDIRHIRIMAIVLFGVTLLKLFFYDMRDMSTIYKTIVLIILGALLLVSSFLYNRSKRVEHESQ